MLKSVQLEKIICIDIETVPQFSSLIELPDVLKMLWTKKSERLREATQSDDEHYFHHAGIYAEFGKVICICIGIFQKVNAQWHLRIKSFSGEDEKQLLTDFSELLEKNFSAGYLFCGHNIKEFDIPYLCRRMLINHLPLPVLLDLSGKKPYEVSMLDTMQLWRFGDYKNYTSLQLLSTILGIETSKDDIEGKDVGRVFWQEKNLLRIATYCQKDVLTVAQLLLRFKGLELLKAENVMIL